jgi:trimeric autotransporter adhesin
VSTTAASASLAPASRGIFYAMLLPIGALAFVGGLNSRRKRLLGLLLTGLMLSGLIFLAACGGGGSTPGGGSHATPMGNYTITVSASSGSLTHTTTVPLTVR